MDAHPGNKGSTFVIRIWLEWSELRPRWRGQMEHVESGRKCAFLSLKDMESFIRSIVSMPLGKDHPGKGETAGNNNV